MQFKINNVSKQDLDYFEEAYDLMQLLSNHEVMLSNGTYPKLKNGAKIHIKKKNRGKFTASAKRHGMGVQEYARKVINNPNATTLQKRRAQFAINSKKWSH